MNVSEIVTEVLSRVGNKTPTATQINEVFNALFDMLSSWSAEKIMIFADTIETFSLNVASGDNFSTVRPKKITKAYVRDSSGIDSPIKIIEREEYHNISSKSTEGRPRFLYCNYESPLARIFLYPDPVVGNSDTLVLVSVKPLTEFTSLDEPVTFPKEYRRAIKSNLLLEIAGFYDYSPSQNDYKIAKESKDNIKKINAKPIITNGVLTKRDISTTNLTIYDME